VASEQTKKHSLVTRSTRDQKISHDYANDVVPISNAVAYREKNLIN
jgi:hypothetical protein